MCICARNENEQTWNLGSIIADSLCVGSDGDCGSVEGLIGRIDGGGDDRSAPAKPVLERLVFRDGR